MSDTPETNALLKQSKIKGRNPNPWELCRKLERERDRAKSSLSFSDGARELTTELCVIGDELNAKLSKERDQYRRYLELIADDCNSWLNGEIEEPSVEFIKAVRDYAKKGIDA